MATRLPPFTPFCHVRCVLVCVCVCAWDSTLRLFLTTTLLPHPCAQSSLIGLDAATVRAMRPKRRVLLVRFISKALLNPFYRQEWVEAPVPGGYWAVSLSAVIVTASGWEPSPIQHLKLSHVTHPSRLTSSHHPRSLLHLKLRRIT